MNQRENFPLVAGDEFEIRLFVPVGPDIFHAVFFGKTFHLAMTEHGKTRQCCEQSRCAEVAVVPAELIHSGFLVGIVHEVDIALQDARIKSQGFLHHGPVFIVLSVPEHVHER